MPQMVWVTRPDGFHEYYNLRWYEFTGVPLGSTDGEGWNGMFHPDDQEAAWARWRRSLATGEPYEIEYRLRHHTGEYRWTLGRAIAIRNQRGEIDRWYGTCTDIDGIKKLTSEREHLLASEQAARAEADNASRAKDKFLAVLSHELRTPLSPVVMAVAEMEIDPDLPFKFREEMAMIRRNIDLETKLIDDLLDLSRVTSGKLRLQMQPVRIHELMQHVIHSSMSDLSIHRLDIHTQLHATNDSSSGDPARLQQVLWNLLRNSIKFTPKGGDIFLRTWNLDSHLFIEVRDTGVGIRPDALPRIFDAFEQGDTQTTRRFGGLGLGLAITKAVVDMHGGTIVAESPGEGRGTTFTVRLSTAIQSDAVAKNVPTESSNTKILRARILLAEDHPDTSRTLARLLRMSGFEVKIAGSVAMALELAASEIFDVVISDIGLPDATGYDLMAQIRERYGMKGIALSGYGMEDDVRKSKDAGFSEHVIKPVNVPELEAVIRRVLDSESSPG
jgi:PAS domain S-box-containing protein